MPKDIEVVKGKRKFLISSYEWPRFEKMGYTKVNEEPKKGVK